MKKKTKISKQKSKKKLSKVSKIRYLNPANSEKEQDALDAFFRELDLSKRIQQEGKYQNQSIIDICNSLIENLNDDMYYENVVEYMREINELLLNLNKELDI